MTNFATTDALAKLEEAAATLQEISDSAYGLHFNVDEQVRTIIEELKTHIEYLESVQEFIDEAVMSNKEEMRELDETDPLPKSRKRRTRY